MAIPGPTILAVLLQWHIMKVTPGFIVNCWLCGLVAIVITIAILSLAFLTLLTLQFYLFLYFGQHTLDTIEQAVISGIT